MTNSLADIGPFIGVISQIICWTGFIITLMMCRGFIATGVSIAVAEFLPRMKQEHREKLARWLGNGEEVLEQLKVMDEKLGEGKEEV